MSPNKPSSEKERSPSPTSPLGLGGITSCFLLSSTAPPSPARGRGLSLLLINIHSLPHPTGDKPGSCQHPPRHPCQKTMQSAHCGKIWQMRGRPAITLYCILTGMAGVLAYCLMCAGPPSLSKPYIKYTLLWQNIKSCAARQRSLCIVF